MIVYTIANSVTDTVYVGTTTSSVEERWAQLQLAAELAIKAPLYKDIRDFGSDCFTVEEYAVADSREALGELFEEAMLQYDGTSLKGLKTSGPKQAASNISSSIATAGVERIVAAASKVAERPAISVASAPVAKPKMASGRTGSATRERNIKEGIERDRQAREALKSQQIAEQADEMKAIMARLDARGSTLRRR
ncbi:MAG: GIY-YIG nuclease family protein [Pseudomonadales bacterium]